MCFSAPASFGAAAILGIAGGYCLYKAKSKSDYVTATAPILFGIQQFVEGLTWLYLGNNIGSGGLLPLSLIFLLIAHVVWPTYIPVGCYLFEKDKTRRKFMTPIVLVGACVSLYLLSKIITGDIGATIRASHIKYSVSGVSFFEYTKYVYLAAVTLPFFFIKSKSAVFLGIFVFSSFAFTHYIAASAFVSVWCFFVAIISFTLALYFYLRDRKNRITE